jgi:hydrogenase maturation protease
MTDAGGVLVLGIGNALRGDDGVGPRVIDALARAAADGDSEALPEGTVLRDGGTAGIGLLFEVVAARRVIVVDAVAPGRAPGTVTTTQATPDGDGPVADLVATASMVAGRALDVTVVGIEAGDVAPGIALTPAVEAAIPQAVAAVVAAARGRGGPTR